MNSNARLRDINADLLKALKDLRHAYRLERAQIFGTDHYEDQAVRAIAKAEGRKDPI